MLVHLRDIPSIQCISLVSHIIQLKIIKVNTMRTFEQKGPADNNTPQNKGGNTSAGKDGKQPLILAGVIVLIVLILAGGAVLIARTIPEDTTLAGAMARLFTGAPDDEENEAEENGDTTSTSTATSTNEDATTTEDNAGTANTGNTGGTVQPTQGAPTVTTERATYPASNPNGTPDLVLLDAMVGVYNDDDNTFTEMDDIDLDDLNSDEEVAVRFTIENQGDKTVESWEFEARLPTRPRETFSHDSDDDDDALPMLPTAGRQYTLTFDRVREGDVEVTISVDPDDDIDESEEDNNDVTIEFETQD